MQSNVKKLKVGLQYYLFRTGPLTMAAGPAALFVRTRAGTRHAGREDLRGAVQLRSAAGRAASVVGLRSHRLSASSGKPRRDQAEIRKSIGSAGDVPELPGDRDRSARHRRRPEDRPPHPRHAAHAALHHRGISARPVGARPTNSCWSMRRNTGGTVFHPTSTCKMGVDPMAVVDPELRVHGMRGPARGRCVDHAHRGVRQHQRRHHHDRREGRRPGAPADCAWRHEHLRTLRRSHGHQRLRHGHAPVRRAHASGSGGRDGRRLQRMRRHDGVAGRRLPRHRAHHRRAGWHRHVRRVGRHPAGRRRVPRRPRSRAHEPAARCRRRPQRVHRRAQPAQHVRPRRCWWPAARIVEVGIPDRYSGPGVRDAAAWEIDGGDHAEHRRHLLSRASAVAAAACRMWRRWRANTAFRCWSMPRRSCRRPTICGASSTGR